MLMKRTLELNLFTGQYGIGDIDVDGSGLQLKIDAITQSATITGFLLAEILFYSLIYQMDFYLG